MEYLYAALSVSQPDVRPRALTPLQLANLPHNNQAPQLNFSIWLFCGLSLGFLSLRIYCKFLRGRGLWWDDHVLIASWLALMLASAFTTVTTTFGYGKHLWDIPRGNFVPLNIMATFAGTFSILAAAWSKTSFAMTVLRISTGWMRWCIWFIIVSVNIVLCASAILQWTKCMPLQKIFNSSIPGQCWPIDIVRNYNSFSTAYSGAMDVVLAIFPWKIIWGMSMSKKEKLGVLFAMSMGVFAGVASFIKVSKIGSLTNPDPSNTIQLVIWGVAETAITIIAASIPILRALLRDGKVSSAPPSESEIELNVANWSNAVNTTVSDAGTAPAISRQTTALTPSTTTNTTKRRWWPFRRTASEDDEQDTGTPSWVTAPVTITTANRDIDSRPPTSSVATSGHSLL